MLDDGSDGLKKLSMIYSNPGTHLQDLHDKLISHLNQISYILLATQGVESRCDDNS